MNDDKSNTNNNDTSPAQDIQLNQYQIQINNIIKLMQDNSYTNTPESQKFFFEVIPMFIGNLLNYK
jgi:hypothetical protein